MQLIEPFEINNKRDLVKQLASFGFSDHEIGCYTGIESVETLHKHFLHELDAGPIETNLEVARSLYEMATKGKSVTAATFWLRCRNGWAPKPAAFVNDEEVNVIYSAEAQD